MTGKENFANFMIQMMKDGQKADMETQAREVAHTTKIMYDAFIAEGFSKADARHMIDMILMSACK